MKTVFLVYGATGEYSDRTEWFIRVFASAKKAAELVTLASAKARELEVKYKRKYIPKGSNPYDLKMQSDYTGTHYYVEEVPFDDII